MDGRLALVLLAINLHHRAIPESNKQQGCIYAHVGQRCSRHDHCVCWLPSEGRSLVGPKCLSAIRRRCVCGAVTDSSVGMLINGSSGLSSARIATDSTCTGLETARTMAVSWWMGNRLPAEDEIVLFELSVAGAFGGLVKLEVQV